MISKRLSIGMQLLSFFFLYFNYLIKEKEEQRERVIQTLH